MAFAIRTERLLIRPFALDDLEAVHPVFSDRDVMRYIPGGACDRAGSLARLQSLIDHHERHGFSKWAVVETASGRLIGDCGLQYLAGEPDIELGFHIARAQWGRGYATEAARACLAWACCQRTERIVAIIDPANKPSIRVLEKLGMQPAATRAISVASGCFTRLSGRPPVRKTFTPPLAAARGQGCERLHGQSPSASLFGRRRMPRKSVAKTFGIVSVSGAAIYNRFVRERTTPVITASPASPRHPRA